MNPIYAESLLTLKNSKSNQIFQYPEEPIKKAKQEIEELMNEIRRLTKELKTKDLQDKDKIFINGKMASKLDTIHRIKRYLLITHDFRCARIEQQFWNFGGQVKQSQLNNLSEKQKNYLLSYKNIVNNYIDEVGLELTMDIEPAIDSVIQIRVVNDCGQIMGFDGEMIKLQKNSVHFIKKKFVEKFIQKGDIVQLN